MRRRLVTDSGVRSKLLQLTAALLCAGLSVAAAGSVARGQTADQAQPVQGAAGTGRVVSIDEDRATSFRTVSGGQQEDVPGGPLTVAAYGVVWLVLFGFVLRLNRLQRGVQTDLERLARSVNEHAGIAAGAGASGSSGSSGSSQGSSSSGSGTAQHGAVS